MIPLYSGITYDCGSGTKVMLVTQERYKMDEWTVEWVSELPPLTRFLPKVLVKKALNAKSSACFLPKSAKIMLIFFKKCLWVTKKILTFFL